MDDKLFVLKLSLSFNILFYQDAYLFISEFFKVAAISSHTENTSINKFWNRIQKGNFTKIEYTYYDMILRQKQLHRSVVKSFYFNSCH